MNTRYRTLSPDYDALFQRHMEAFRKRLTDTYSEQKRYTDFYPSIGVADGNDADVLVYGQAVGGWHPELDYREDIPRDRTKESKLYSNAAFPGHSPLDWVNVLWTNGTLKKRPLKEQRHYEERERGYRAWSSFFWQTTIALMQQRLRITDDEHWGWHKDLVWSNLYKIAPQDYTREEEKEKFNPTEADCALQRPEAVELVRMELDELQPKLCVVLTNETWWAPFAKGLEVEPIGDVSGKTIDRVDQYKGTRIIVVKRGWGISYKDAVKEIIKASQ